MKILHTSDWHLGQYFMGKSRQSEHSKFLNWLIDVATKQSVDAILVVGDIFDTGAPPSYARELYNQFIDSLQKASQHKSIQLIILGGNHDSVATLAESKNLLHRFNTSVVPGASSDISDHVIPVKDANDKVLGIVCAVPFLRARDVVESNAGQSGHDKQKNLQQGIRDFYHRVYQQAVDYKEKGKLSVPIIATGHLSVVGASCSDSVRDIYIGSLDAFPVSGFPPADYIALGHIHRPQKVTEHIRYCGSPIALSFDELNTDKKVLIVTFEQNDLKNIQDITIPEFQEMHLIKGDISSIETQIQEIKKKSLKNTSLEENEIDQRIWLDVEVHTQDFLNDLSQRVESMVENTNMDVLVLRRARKQRQQSLDQVEELSLHELSPKEVFDRRLECEQWPDDQLEMKDKLMTRFNYLLETIDDEMNDCLSDLDVTQEMDADKYVNKDAESKAKPVADL